MFGSERIVTFPEEREAFLVTMSAPTPVLTEMLEDEASSLRNDDCAKVSMIIP